MGDIRTEFFLAPTHLRINAAIGESCRARVVDNTETRFINGGRLADELSRVLPRHFHVENTRLAIADMTLYLRHTIGERQVTLSS